MHEPMGLLLGTSDSLRLRFEVKIHIWLQGGYIWLQAGDIPMDWARRERHTEVARLLADAPALRAQVATPTALASSHSTPTPPRPNPPPPLRPLPRSPLLHSFAHFNPPPPPHTHMLLARGLSIICAQAAP